MNAEKRPGNLKKALFVLVVLLVALLLVKYDLNKEKTAVAEPSLESENEQAEEIAKAVVAEPQDDLAKSRQETPTTAEPPKLTDEQAELRGDAKSTLAAAYTMMVAVYAEFDRYTSDLSSSMFYEGDVLEAKSGFLDVYRPRDPFLQENPDRKDSDFFVEASKNADRPIKYSEAAEKIDLQSLAKYCDKRCEASEREFEFMVAVNLDDDPELDVWTINERKELIHRYDDLTNTEIK